MLHNTKHHIRTGHGTSEEFIRAPENITWSGVGQGSCYSFPIWIVSLQVLLNLYRSVSKGAVFTNPNGQVSYACVATTYIDDINLLIKCPKGENSREEMIEQAKRLIAFWEEAL